MHSHHHHLPILSFLSLFLLPTAHTATHSILVGQTGLNFTPNTTRAAVGDTLVFHFFPENHNVAQGSLESPCMPLPGGFYSGYISPASGEDATTFTVTVNDTEPIWLYCSAVGHCQNGMVGVVNVGSTPLETYFQGAEQTTRSETPAHIGGGVISDSSSNSNSNPNPNSSSESSSNSVSTALSPLVTSVFSSSGTSTGSSSSSASSAPQSSASPSSTASSAASPPSSSTTQSESSSTTASASPAAATSSSAAIAGRGDSGSLLLSAVGVVLGAWVGVC